MIETKSKPRVALGMSGGVDSSLCAHLLLEQGYDVTGVYLECWRAPGCRSEEDRADALKVALSLGIPFQVLDFKENYRQKVVENFFHDYEAGITPNPDVLCNKEIKFGLFYDWAMKNNFDFVATGHYAKISDGELCIPQDAHKDQTYFLYLIRQEQLQHTLFPLANYTKPEVRAEAEKRGLHVASKKDSVGICFIGDINVHQFLKDRLGENPGEVVDTQGNVIGKHQGLWFYTVGQRHGFTVDKKTLLKTADGSVIEKENFPPFYVIKKIPEKNQLVVGFGAETYQDHLTVSDVHWIKPEYQVVAEENQKLVVRIRHTGKLIACTVANDKTGSKDSNLQIKLSEPTQGISEGQSAVLYAQKGDETVCLGGGVIR